MHRVAAASDARDERAGDTDLDRIARHRLDFAAHVPEDRLLATQRRNERRAVIGVVAEEDAGHRGQDLPSATVRRKAVARREEGPGMCLQQVGRLGRRAPQARRNLHGDATLDGPAGGEHLGRLHAMTALDEGGGADRKPDAMHDAQPPASPSRAKASRQPARTARRSSARRGSGIGTPRASRMSPTDPPMARAVIRGDRRLAPRPTPGPGSMTSSAS